MSWFCEQDTGAYIDWASKTTHSCQFLETAARLVDSRYAFKKHREFWPKSSLIVAALKWRAISQQLALNVDVVEEPSALEEAYSALFATELSRIAKVSRV